MKEKKIIFILPEDYTFSIPAILRFKKRYAHKIVGLIFTEGFFEIKKLISILFLFNFTDHIKFLIKNIKKKEFDEISKIKNISSNNINSKKISAFIKKNRPDYLIICGCNQILKKKIFKIPRINTYNIHSSKLPKYRGVLPIFRAYQNNEKNFTISIHEVNNKIDDGPICNRKTIKIKNKDKLIDLYLKSFKHMPSIINSAITNNKKIKNNKKFGSYYSYPSLMELIKFRIRKIFN